MTGALIKWDGGISEHNSLLNFIIKHVFFLLQIASAGGPPVLMVGPCSF